MLLVVPLLSKLLASTESCASNLACRRTGHSGRRTSLQPAALSLLGVLAVGIGSCEVAVSRAYVALWRTPQTTIANSVAVSPSYYRTRYIRATQLTAVGRGSEALDHYQAAAQLFPQFIEVRCDRRGVRYLPPSAIYKGRRCVSKG